MFLILVFFRWFTMGKAPNKELWIDLMNLQCFLRHYFHHHHHHCHHLRPRCNLVHQAEERLSHQLILYIIGEDTVFGDSPCKWHTDNIRSRCISGRFEDSHCAFKHQAFYHFHQYHRHGLCHYMMVSSWSPSSSSFTASFISIFFSCLSLQQDPRSFLWQPTFPPFALITYPYYGKWRATFFFVFVTKWFNDYCECETRWWIF